MEERFAFVTECGNKTSSGESITWIIKVSDIHRFDEKTYSKLKSYKFNSPDEKY